MLSTGAGIPTEKKFCLLVYLSTRQTFLVSRRNAFFKKISIILAHSNNYAQGPRKKMGRSLAPLDLVKNNDIASR